MKAREKATLCIGERPTQLDFPQPDSHEPCSSSVMLKITFSVRLSPTLFADFDTQLRASRFIAPLRFERCKPMTTGTLSTCAWLAKFSDAVLVAESANAASSRLDRRISGATFTNMLGLRMARVDRLRKVWWLPQLASVAFSLGQIREEQTAPEQRVPVPDSGAIGFTEVMRGVVSGIVRRNRPSKLPGRVNSDKVSAMASLIREVGETFVTLYKGFSVTFRTMFRKTTTESFPDVPPSVQPRYRGIHVLQRDEHGFEKCVGCFLCAAACPANCIYIEAAENTDANRISAGERYAKVYNIDYSRCIFCGYCVEACPTDAITHGHSLELAPYDINSLIYRKEKLLEPWPARTSPSSTES
jgi:NADH-quinone oxidoreductase subunit I